MIPLYHDTYQSISRSRLSRTAWSVTSHLPLRKRLTNLCSSIRILRNQRSLWVRCKRSSLPLTPCLHRPVKRAQIHVRRLLPICDNLNAVSLSLALGYQQFFFFCLGSPTNPTKPALAAAAAPQSTPVSLDGLWSGHLLPPFPPSLAFLLLALCPIFSFPVGLLLAGKSLFVTIFRVRHNWAPDFADRWPLTSD